MTFSRLVVDNSVVVCWCIGEQASPYSDAVLEYVSLNEMVVPGIWPLEIGNVLLVSVRRTRIAEFRVSEILAVLDSFQIDVVQESRAQMLGEILSLARRHNLSTYDASYLALAIREGLPLATLDKALKRAATECNVPLFDVK